MNMVSFNVKFQSDSINDGQTIAGGIYATSLPVKHSSVMVDRVISHHIYCGLPGLSITQGHERCNLLCQLDKSVFSGETSQGFYYGCHIPRV